MLTLRKVCLLAAVALAGCAQIEVRNADVGPGGVVTTNDPTKEALLGWMPQITPANSPGIDHWYRIRVIAPEGATVCRSSDLPSQGGPQRVGQPDENREVMLTVPQGARSAHFECKTPGGVVGRKVEASVYTRPIPASAPPHIVKQLKKMTMENHVISPLVHIDPRDPGAEARWAAFGAEVCPVISDSSVNNKTGFVCLPGMLEKFRAVDLGASAG